MAKSNNKKAELETIEIQEQAIEQDISICLVMIVKDEEDTIEKCIRAVAPYISHWVIVDTGSDDNTIDVINKVTKDLDIPGELHERPWVNFEVNRTESLELSKNICEYRWIIDADDIFIPDDPSKNPFVNLDKSADAFQLLYKLDHIQYFRAQLVKSDEDWVYKGVLHEYLHLPDKEGPVHQRIAGGHVAASISPLKRAGSLKEKYAKDAEILKEALIKEPENARYAFYLGQSYRDSGQLDAAIESYTKRAEMGGWEEEVYYSLYMIGRLKEARKDSIIEVTNAYSMAWEFRPQRLEALFHVMRKLREQNRHILSFAYGMIGLKAPSCNDILFIEKEMWDWRFLDEFSLAAFHSGNPGIGAKHLDPIIKADFFKNLPEKEQERMKHNMQTFVKATQSLEKKKQAQ